MVFLTSSEGIILPACSHPLRKGPAGRTATQTGNHICFPSRMDAKGKVSHLETIKSQRIPKKDAPSQRSGNPVAAPKTALAHCSKGSGTEQSTAWKLRASRYYPLCRNKRGDLEMRILEQGLLIGKNSLKNPHQPGQSPIQRHGIRLRSGKRAQALQSGPTSVGWAAAGYGLTHVAG